MTWQTWPDRQLAERTLNEGELQVLILKSLGYGRRRGSLALGISDEAWRYRMRRAMQKLEAAKKAAA